MPLYFAYTTHMDVSAMAERCPGAKLIGTARLMRHRFVITPEGQPSVVRDPRQAVHGVLWDIGFGQLRTIDSDLGLTRGLCTKALQPVLKTGGGGACALIYFGMGEAGRAPNGLMEQIIAAARAQDLPAGYVKELESQLPRGGAPVLVGGALGGVAAEASAAVLAKRPALKPSMPGVRPRFATPFDRT